MFNPFKFLKKNNSLKVSDIIVSKTVSESTSGYYIEYFAFVGGFEIVFEYIDYFHVTNKIGQCKILLNNVVIHQEPHNITLSTMKPEKYIKNCFSRLIHHVNQLDDSKISNILPFFKSDIFNYTQSLAIHNIRKFSDISVYTLSLNQKNDVEIPYSLRFNAPHLNNIKVIDFFGKPFNHMTSKNKLSRQFTDASSAIYGNCRIAKYPAKYTAYKFGDNLQEIFYNPTLNEALFYCVFQHELSDSNNKIVLYSFWYASFSEKSVKLITLIYDGDKFLGEYNEPIENRFIDDDIDQDYYKNFLEIYIEKLLIIYFPTQVLADFLVIPDFNGRLTEEQYDVFAMYSI